MKMTSKRRRSNAPFALTAIASIAAAMCFGSAAFAQEAAAQAAPAKSADQAGAGDQKAEPAEIIVTGSRIQSSTADSPSPVQVLTSEDIEKSGAVNIQELLNKSPAIGTPGISRTNSNFATSSAGVSTVNLRNLGEDRTLVLVNGRRYVSGVPGSAAVDLNTIPVDFIDRVEIYTGGASAIYGSDAVAGVVNIILKHNFQGLTLDAQTGETSRHDNTTHKVGITGGVSSDDGRSNIMAHFGYSKEGKVWGKDRRGGKVDNIPLAYLDGDPAHLFDFVAPFYSSFAPQGRFFSGDTDVTFDHNGNVIPVDTNGANGPATGFNRQSARLIAIPTERYLFATSGESELAEHHSVFFEGTYAQTRTQATLEPFPLDSADSVTGLYPATGVGPAEFNVNGQILANPLIPPALLALMSDTDGDGLRDYSFSRRLAEVGNRGADANRDTFRVLTGFKGDIGQDWHYETYVSYGSTKEAQVSGGQVNVLNFRNAMEAIPDLNDANNNGSTTDAICRDANARAQGCVPANIFGYNTLTPEMLKYITAPSMLETLTTQKTAGASINGEPVMLPAGPLGIAAGAEWRKEFARTEFDSLTQAGLNASNAIPATEGHFSVKEGFVEVKVPLLKDLPLVDMLTARGALRLGDYTTVGKVTSYTLGLEWAPINDVRIRATSARSTRAPNITELYSPPSQNFPAVSDPCEGVAQTDTGTLADRCRAAPGVLDNMAANGGVFTLNQADLQGTSGFDRGNPDLDEEVGKSWTVGFVVQPTDIEFLKKMTLEVDYYNVKIDDAIVQTPRQFLLDQCYNGGDETFCQYVTRRPADVGANSAGSLQRVDTAYSNSGGLVSRGFDVALNWNDRLGPGRMQTGITYSHLVNGYVVAVPGADKDHFSGEVGSAKDKFTVMLGYDWNSWYINTTTTYIGESALDDQLLAQFDAAPGSVTVAPRAFVDMQLGYTWKAATIYFGMDNVFDTKGPQYDTNALLGGDVGTTGAGTQADVYDVIGRSYYLGLRIDL